MDAQPGERILDLCASPGGKSVAIAASMHDSGTLVASDVRVGRIALLRDTVRKSGAHHAHVVHVPAAGPLPFASTFDRVLVDAPCSGLGTIRRDPDIRWRRAPGDLPRPRISRSSVTRRPMSSGPEAVLSTQPARASQKKTSASSTRFSIARRSIGLGPSRIVLASLATVLDDGGAPDATVHARPEAFFAVAMVRRNSS
jgi:16S rRNA (cytosine967-C5)-methyltransferase